MRAVWNLSINVNVVYALIMNLFGKHYRNKVKVKVRVRAGASGILLDSKGSFRVTMRRLGM